MRRKLIFILGITAILCATMAWAEGRVPAEGVLKRDLRQAEYAADRETMAVGRISINNDTQNFSINNEIKETKYGKDGYIESVVYDDGSKAKYSYEFGSDGKLNVCKIEKDNGDAITFKSNGTSLKMTINKSSEDNKSVEKPVIIEILLPDSAGKTPLDTIAKNPIKFDFDKIWLAVSDASKQKKDAYKEYLKNSEAYYVAVLKELKEKFSNLKAEDIDLKDGLKELSSKDVNKAESREDVDDAVGSVKSQSHSPSPPRTASVEFLNFEKKHRDRVLNPAKEIYDGKIENALKYLNAVIDEVVNSKYAVYLNSKNDKIEAVVQLPQEQRQ